METTESPQYLSSAPKRPRLSRQQAEELLAEWQVSQRSLAAFARERGLDVKRLYSWRQRLDQFSACEALSGGSGLAQVRMIDHRPMGAVVTLPNGIRIELGGDWSSSAIAALCGALSC